MLSHFSRLTRCNTGFDLSVVKWFQRPGEPWRLCLRLSIVFHRPPLSLTSSISPAVLLSSFLSFTVSPLMILPQRSPHPPNHHHYHHRRHHHLSLISAALSWQLYLYSASAVVHTRTHSSSLCPCPHWPTVWCYQDLSPHPPSPPPPSLSLIPLNASWFMRP